MRHKCVNIDCVDRFTPFEFNELPILFQFGVNYVSRRLFTSFLITKHTKKMSLALTAGRIKISVYNKISVLFKFFYYVYWIFKNVIVARVQTFWLSQYQRLTITKLKEEKKTK